MVIYAKDDGEAIYKFLQTLVTDEQIAAAPSYYKYGAGAFENTIEGMRRNGGIDHLLEVGALTEKWVQSYVQSLIAGLGKMYFSLKEGKFDDEQYDYLAHILVAIKIESRQVSSRFLSKLKDIFRDGIDFVITDGEVVDTVAVPREIRDD